MVLQTVICKVGARDPQRTLSSDQRTVLQHDSHCSRALPPDHNGLLGVHGPSESAVLPTESQAPWATPDLKQLQNSRA